MSINSKVRVTCYVYCLMFASSASPANPLSVSHFSYKCIATKVQYKIQSRDFLLTISLAGGQLVISRSSGVTPKLNPKFHIHHAKVFAFFCIFQCRKRLHSSLVPMGNENGRCKRAFSLCKSANKAVHPGFEIQRRRHQKFKQGF